MFCGIDRSMDFIRSCAYREDEEIDAGALALAFVWDDHQTLKPAVLERYVRHFSSIAEQVRMRYRALLDAGSADDASVRLAALKYAIYEDQGYRHDEQGYEMIESADMIRVINRGAGCRAALALLYMDAARRCGWEIEGMNVASFFLCRLSHGTERLIFDPGRGCAVLQAHDLRMLVKSRLGENAELCSEYLSGLDAKQSIIYLCNYLKHRRIEMGEYGQALLMIQRMQALVPDEYRLLLDAGVLYARVGDSDNARESLQSYIEKAPNAYDRYEAQLLLDEID
ncbi:MAG: tetratricopeptide repeat protein [Alphaproteobacteria bacterium]